MLRFLLPVVVAGVVAFSGCKKPVEPPVALDLDKDYSRPLPPGELALRKIDPSAYPDFSRAFYGRAGLVEAIENSLDYMAKPSSETFYPYGDITHERVVASLDAFLAVLDMATTPQELDAMIRRDFDVYQSVGCDDCGTVFFTGYYCPIFDGRKERDSEFRYPLYAMPDDLIKDELGQVLGRKTSGGSIVPYYTRQEIDSTGCLAGNEIAWLKDPFEAYVVTVQGSARLKLEDGTLWELGYAANNGHEYAPVAYALVRDGKMDRDDISLQAMIAYFKAHPEDVDRYCFENERYVFFREAPGGPFGALNTPVILNRTIATDKGIFPRAALAYIVTTLPALVDGRVKEKPANDFVLDQDTGGAIRAAGRCDIFMGIGKAAEALAGRTGAEGKLYYLFLKPGKM